MRDWGIMGGADIQIVVVLENMGLERNLKKKMNDFAFRRRGQLDVSHFDFSWEGFTM